MKIFWLKIITTVVLIVLIVFAIVIFRHGRTSATPQSENKQAVTNIQDRAGKVESQPSNATSRCYPQTRIAPPLLFFHKNLVCLLKTNIISTGVN